MPSPSKMKATEEEKEDNVIEGSKMGKMKGREDNWNE